MPISYSILQDGHFIHAKAIHPVTFRDFVEYEVAHAIDERIKTPIKELFEVEHGALKNITNDDILTVTRRRKEMGKPPLQHRCAIVVSYANTHGWDLAKFYEGMVTLHSPESVIIFGDKRIAKIWLGVADG